MAAALATTLLGATLCGLVHAQGLGPAPVTPAQIQSAISPLIGAASGIAGLDATGKMAPSALPNVSALTGYVDPTDAGNITKGTISTVRLPASSTLQTFLGLGSAALANTSAFDAAGAAGAEATRAQTAEAKALQAANAFSDITNFPLARSNLGLGAAALLNVGTTTGTVADGGVVAGHTATLAGLATTYYPQTNPSSFITNAAVTAKIGSTTSSGHTTTPMTIAFSTVAVGGTTVTQSGIVDPASSVAPGVGAACWFKPSSTAMFPTNINVDCIFSPAGTVNVRAVPIAGLALGAVSLTGNIFWTW